MRGRRRALPDEWDAVRSPLQPVPAELHRVSELALVRLDGGWIVLYF